MSAAVVSRWARSFVVAGVLFFVAWNLAVVLGAPRAATVVLGLQGFVFSVVFGKAYALVPTYFARELAVPRAPAVHLPLAVVGVLAMFLGRTSGSGPLAIPLVEDFAAVGSVDGSSVAAVGAVLWFAGVLVFVGTIAWTVRDNPLGVVTGTGDVNRHRERVDRAANGAVPIVLLYLVIGATVPVLGAVGAPTGPFAPGPASSHVLAAGAATLLVLAIGFRLLPRFLVETPRLALVALALPTAVLAPLLLAMDFLGEATFRIGAGLQALALVAFALAYADMFRRSDRRRVGTVVVLVAVSLGVVAILLGLYFAFTTPVAGATDAHYRLAVGGFLGLTIVGVTYQFYPPAIGGAPGVDDRGALLAAITLATGIGVEALGLVVDHDATATGGSLVALVGAAGYAYVLLAVLSSQR